MTAKDQRTRGIDILTEIFTRTGSLRVKAPRTFNGGFSYYFEVTGYGKVADFCLTAEVLEDMEGTRGYQEQANHFAWATEQRLRNPNPIAFMTKRGVPVEVESTWPPEPWPGRAASIVRTNVRNLMDSTRARCFVVTTHGQQVFELKQNPFVKFGAIVNSVRDAVDAGKVVFYEDAIEPDTLQQVDLRLEQRQRDEQETLEIFLERKIFWLGFKVGNMRSFVWLTDPWDADYLGSSSADLAREAEVLEAHNIVQLEKDRQFGSSGRELLLRARELETSIISTQRASGKDQRQAGEWDVFISHASEDKLSFVHPLAEALQQRGLRVWYDKFTLTLGDSLRQKIDDGLRSSRFGLVVLSPHFFNKDWPQKELDGLVALEVDSRKVILPIWHGVSRNDVAKFSPILAGRLAVSTSTGLENVVAEILRAIG